MKRNITMSQGLVPCLTILSVLVLVGCGGGMNAASYNAQGMQQLNQYDCAADTSFKRAADMELENEGDRYPLYMLDLAISRIYCNSPDNAIKAFLTVDNYIVKKSERSDVTKAVGFFLSKSRQLYDLKEREETLLHYYIGLANYQSSNFEDAMVELRKVDYIAEGVYSKLPLSSLMRGLVYLKLGDRGNALVGFRDMMEKNPKSTLGYKLAILNETDRSKRDFYKREMKEKTGMEFVEPPPGKTPAIVIVDLAGKIDMEKESIRLELANQDAQAAFVDIVDPDFDFGKLVGGFLADAASLAGRIAAKEALKSSIPIFGGLIGDALMGDERGDGRAWYTLPTMYFGDVVYLDDKDHELSIRYYNGADMKRERKVNIRRHPHGVHSLRF